MPGGRMRDFYIAGLAGAVMMVAGSATAADLGPGPVQAAPAVGPVAAFSWSGPYAGLFAGYGWGTADASEPINAATGFFYNLGSKPYSVNAE